MAHIVEFKIDGLAGRKDTYSKKLKRDLNIFYGLNGSGKTSLLKILHSAMSRDASILKNVPFEEAVVKIFSIDFGRIFTQRISKPKREKRQKIEESTEQLTFELESTEAAYNWDIKPKQQDIGTSWSHQYLPTSRYFVSRRPHLASRHYTASELISSEDKIESFFAEALRSLWVEFSSTLLRQVTEAQEGGLASILKAILTGEPSKTAHHKFDTKTAFDRVAKFLSRQGSPKLLGPMKDFQKRLRQNKQLRSVVTDINNVEIKIEQAMGPRQKLQELITQMFSGNKNILLKDKTIEVATIDDIEIGLKSLSAGEKQLLRILIETLLTGDNSIIIDEPELSMHVDWQVRLINAMRQLNPKSQIIVATHSPEIMAEVADSKVFKL